MRVVSKSGRRLSDCDDQHSDLGAAQDDSLRPGFHQAVDDAQVFRFRGRLDLAKHQFVIDDPVHDLPVSAIRDEHIQVVLFDQPAAVEILCPW